MSRNIRLRIEYDGTGLCGWQRQDGDPTVQGILEAALTVLLGHPVTCAAASRTDAGVHAEGQVVGFPTTHPTIPAHGIRKALNSSLPPGIAVVDAEEAPADFHPRFGSSGKLYRYRLLVRPSRSALRARTTWHLPFSIDLEAMRSAAAALIGEHDFAAFRASGCTAKTTQRRITAIDIEGGTDDEVQIWVRGNAFLRNMVRIIAGTLVEIGSGRRPVSDMADILASRDRTRAGRTAPAHGLTLVRVFYPPESA